jgi:RHS repeat-associated protein
MGRLIGTTTSYSFLTSRSFTNSYTYDAASNRIGFTDPESGSTTYAYDTLNRLTTLTPPSAFSGGSSFGFSYDALSRRTQMTRPNGVTTNYTYDNLSRLLSVLHQDGGGTIDGATYTMDAAGNRTAKTNHLSGLTSSYAYDSIYELTQVTQAATTTESYSYDPVGNRTASLGVSSYTTNASNELTATPSATYAFDDNGNTMSKTDSTGTTSNTWDYENRLTSVALPGTGGTVYFKYDPFGRRIYKQSATATSIFAYDGYDIVEESNSGGTPIARYSQGLSIDEPLTMLRSSATSYYEADGLGSITSLTNASGAVASTYTYDSFGNVTNSTGTIGNSFRYTGREFDTETNLHFYRARYYDKTAGKFISEDPTGFDAGVDFYSYALNDPATFRDPYGLDVIVCFFSNPALGFGHVGFGFPGDPFTVGFYPNPDSEWAPINQLKRMDGPGGLFPDVGEGPRTCKWIHTTPGQDTCMLQCRISRLQNPGEYNFYTRQCTNFVRNCLKQCGIPTGPSSDPRPDKFFPSLPGQLIPNLPPNAPLPRSAPK